MKKKTEKKVKKKNNEPKKIGRPKLFNNENDLSVLIDEFFDYCDLNGKPYTLSGLANHIGIDRKTLVNYSKDEEFFHTIKRAKDKCMQYAEECLYRSGGNVTGIIFAMKNNYGFVDAQQLDANVDTSVHINVTLDD